MLRWTKMLLLIVFPLVFWSSPASSWNLVWSDDFDGSAVDDSKWVFENGDGCPSLCGFGNNELQWYQSENTYVSNGNLVIEAKQENVGGKSYTSSRLITKGKNDWKYGKVEIRARLPEGQGIWPAIWMLPTDNVHGIWPKSGEIDIAELVGHDSSKVHMTAHYGHAWNNKGQKSVTHTLSNKKFSEDFHTFTIEWKEDEIKWLLDDDVKQTLTKSHVTSNSGFTYPFNEKFYLILNVAVGGNWPGSPDSSTSFPQKLEIDYVKVYSK